MVDWMPWLGLMLVCCWRITEECWEVQVPMLRLKRVLEFADCWFHFAEEAGRMLFNSFGTLPWLTTLPCLIRLEFIPLRGVELFLPSGLPLNVARCPFMPSALVEWRGPELIVPLRAISCSFCFPGVTL